MLRMYLKNLWWKWEEATCRTVKEAKEKNLTCGKKKNWLGDGYTFM